MTTQRSQSLSRTISTALVLAAFLLVPSPGRTEPHRVRQPTLHFSETSSAPENCVIHDLTGLAQSTRGRTAAATTLPPLLWPLGQALHDEIFVGNYRDNDPGALFLDYQGGRNHGYNGHLGTDFHLLNFRVMDRGVAIRAAAEGRVISATHHNQDRNYAPPYPDGGNGLTVESPDGSRIAYWHLRTSSIGVNVGESVEAGQFLGYVGSSGWTPIPHLHFEIWAHDGSGRVNVDPFAGPHSQAQSYWAQQPAYVGNAPLFVMDGGVFTPAAVDGDLGNITHITLKEKIQAPAVYGSDETTLNAWLMLQGNPGQQCVIEVIDPQQQIYATDTYRLSGKARYTWIVLSWDFSGSVGTWKLRARVDGRVTYEKPFEVGRETEYGPRFWLASGRSFRITGRPQHDVLEVSSLSGPVTFSLRDAPADVVLQGYIVMIPSVSSQPYRSSHFQAIATDAAGRTDVKWFHIVDPSKPVQETPTPVTVQQLHATASDGGMRLSWSLASEALAELESVEVQRASHANGPFVALHTLHRLTSSMSYVDLGTQRREVYWYRLLLRARDQSTTFAGPVRVAVAGVEQSSLPPLAMDTASAHMEIRYAIGPSPTHARLSIYDVRGRRVCTLAAGLHAAGEFSVAWDRRDRHGRPVHRGIYWVHLDAAPTKLSQKLLLLHRPSQ